MLDWWLLTVFGFLIGILASMTGVGGGVFIVPILTFFYGFVVNAATGTSLATIIFTAIASTFNYAKQKRVYYKTGLILVTTTGTGSLHRRMVRNDHRRASPCNSLRSLPHTRCHPHDNQPTQKENTGKGTKRENRH